MSLDQYKVFNLIEDVKELKVLLILESPHINEYIHQHPAAGESALELTQFLKSQGYCHDFDNQLPIGCNIKTLHYKSLGILNCSTLPMNKAFYPCVLSVDDLSQVHHLTSIKQDLNQSLNQHLNQNHQQKQYINLAEEVVFKDFANRLTQVLEQSSSDIIIVPCGDTATGFITTFKTIYHQPLMILDSLPHPTESDWTDKINTIRLNNTLNNAIPKQMLP
ncbi:hypothetical protein ES754_03535 [Psychrobacter frigidicola]|uniref:Uncharacterized protein n=1 Tax=Psychrobacter frigidicola TaxID=45611 RepID=A0A5C7A5T5_9GAMM|nr:hypothetical protein [Psychrobacter frigidicola]TXD98035.1 hypothetical protein ES754_03535 [Psychrobacter frigidicola]